MSKLLWLLPVLAFVAIVSPLGARPEPEDDFGVLTTTRPATTQGLPSGVEPDQPAAPAVSSGPMAIRAAAPNPFPLPANANPWMICAATYINADGSELARQVTLELRNKHKLSAYIYNRGDEERLKQLQDWEARKKKYPGVEIKWRGYRVTDQYAVVIDGFKDFASATAFLPRVKALPIPVLKLEGDKSPYDTMVYEEPDHNKKQIVARRANINPFHNAMVVRNPGLASMQTNRPRFDPFWKELNAGEPHSLFDNPKKYSLVVKEYTGLHMIQPQSGMSAFLNSLGLGKKEGETLDAAAAQARELVRFLRTPQIGFEAWVLHTRQSSAVFVGGFDGPEDPELQRVRRQLSALKFSTKDKADPISLYPTPPLIEIPRE